MDLRLPSMTFFISSTYWSNSSSGISSQSAGSMGSPREAVSTTLAGFAAGAGLAAAAVLVADAGLAASSEMPATARLAGVVELASMGGIALTARIAGGIASTESLATGAFDSSAAPSEKRGGEFCFKSQVLGLRDEKFKKKLIVHLCKMI